MSVIDKSVPVKPRYLDAKISHDEEILTLTMRDGPLLVGLFMMVWLTIWTIGCVALLWAVLTQKQPFMILFAFPFWLGWFAGASVLLNSLFGWQRISLHPEGLDYQRQVIIPFSHRHVPLEEICQFELKQSPPNSESPPTTSIVASTLGRSVSFGSILSEKEQQWLAHLLEQHLDGLRGRLNLAAPGEGDLPECQNCERPSDGAWFFEQEFQGVTFVQYGRFRIVNNLWLLFVCGFWNSLVAIFLATLLGFAPVDNAPPQGGERWFMAIFLIPFEVIGLAMLFALLLQLTEPFRVTRWTFDLVSVRKTTTRFGLPLGLQKSYSLSSYGDVSIHGDAHADFGPEWARKTFNMQMSPSGEHFGLLLSDANREEICTIKGLTLGEARWMKGRLQASGLLR